MMDEASYELKYCERCGSLGTRRAHSSDTYCESCAQILTQVVLPGTPGRRPRLPRAGDRKPMAPKLHGQAELACGRPQ